MKNRTKYQKMISYAKFTFVLSGIFLVQSIFVQLHAQESKITLQQENKTIREIMTLIEKSTNTLFLYNNKDVDVNRKLTLNVKDTPLTQVLDLIFANTNNDYKIDGRQIYITRKKETNKDKKNEKKKLSINGIVVDEAGEPLIGVNILIMGTLSGVTTDLNGRFSCTAPENGQLKVSYIGFQPQMVNVNGNDRFKIILREGINSLDEVIVVAYGTQKKETVTGSVSTIQTKDLLQSSSANLTNALSGKLPGLTSIQSSGQPGMDDAALYLRGVGTTNGQNPLILIDGVPRDNLMAIDASEVASVSILKDASATAVFGVRGANGVIMITTRRGTADKAEFSVNIENSWNSFIRKPVRIHSWEYMNLRNQALQNDGKDILYTDDIISRYTNPNKTDVENYIYPDHYYYGENIREFTPQTRVNMNMSGGSKKFQYFISAAYLHQGGQFKTEPKSKLGYDPQTKLDRFSFRTNIDYEINKNLKTFLNLGSYIEKVGMPGSNISGVNMENSIIEAMYLLNSTLPITPGPTTIEGFDAPGDEVITADYLPERSGFMIINRVGARKETRLNFNGSFGLTWDLGFLTKGLNTKLMVSYDTRASNVSVSTIMPRKYNVKPDYDKNSVSFPSMKSEKNPIMLNKWANSQYTINLQYSFNYERMFNDTHRVGGLLLVQRDYWESVAGEMPYNYIGLVGRVTYSYKDRYLFDINAGYNGSEQFAPKNRFGFFPSFSAGWVVTNEPKLQNFLNNASITHLKLRASYGKVGNDKLGGARFLYLDENTIQSSGSFYAENPLSSLGRGKYILEGKIGNSELQWEITTKKNFGFDLGLFKDLQLSFDYYMGNTDKILISRHTVPMIQGVNLSKIPKSNQGKMKNSGFEIELTYRKKLKKELLLSFRGNFGYNTNKVVYFDETVLPEDYAYRYRTTGFIYGQQWGYIIDDSNGNGYFNSQDEIDGYLDKNGDKIVYEMGAPRPGDFKYKDLNNDGRIDTKDMAPIGGSFIPQITYGLSLGAEYKWFDLSVMFQGLAKYYSNYTHTNVYELGLQGAYLDYHKNAWTEERYAKGEKITYPALGTIQNVNHQPNNFFIMNRSFLRLKEVVLGFTLPKQTFRCIGITRFRIYASGQNLFTWDKLRTASFDPEQLGPTSYPIARAFSIGANITF